MHASLPARLMIAVLAVAGMQLCCCKLGSGRGCHGREAPAVQAGSHGEDTGARCCEGDDRDAPAQPCRCATRDAKSPPGGPVKIEMPAPTLIGVVAWAEPLMARADGFTCDLRHGSAPPRPPTSLLRQHCALIV